VAKAVMGIPTTEDADRAAPKVVDLFNGDLSVALDYEDGSRGERLSARLEDDGVITLFTIAERTITIVGVSLFVGGQFFASAKVDGFAVAGDYVFLTWPWPVSI
jgi:hypothetical protein